MTDTNKRWVATVFDNNKKTKEKEATAITRATPDDNEGGRAVTPDASVSKDNTNISDLQGKSEITSETGGGIKLFVTPKEEAALATLRTEPVVFGVLRCFCKSSGRLFGRL